MTVLLHFLFIVFKSLILSLLYTFVVWLLWVLFLKVRKKYSGLKWRKIFAVYIVVCILLLIFSFTYYGDRGFGDNSRIPLGYGEVMIGNDQSAYFVPKGKTEQIHVGVYFLKGDNLCMSVDSGYKVYNIKSKGVINFSEEMMYNAFAVAYGVPLSRHLLSFRQQYDAYWSGWRFWLLP